MGRCIICNYCRETDGGNREVKWSERENGSVCSECAKAIFAAGYVKKNRYEYSPTDGEVPFLIEDDDAFDVPVEGFDLLEEFAMDGDPETS
jgi:hypothetical protein